LAEKPFNRAWQISSQRSLFNIAPVAEKWWLPLLVIQLMRDERAVTFFVALLHGNSLKVVREPRRSPRTRIFGEGRLALHALANADRGPGRHAASIQYYFVTEL